MTAPVAASSTQPATTSATANAASRAGHPIVAAAERAAAGFAILAGSLIAFGLVVTHLLNSSVGSWDEHVNSWLAAHRDATLNWMTADFTDLADTLGILIVAAVAVICLLVLRKGAFAAALVLGLALELAGFLSANYAVQRPRPMVPHVGSTPSTFSWPSGHVAATFALYGGIAVIVTVLSTRAWPKILAWGAASILVICVAFSRMYRGEHHPTDTVAGLLLGVGAVAISWAALRTWRHAAPRPPAAAR